MTKMVSRTLSVHNEHEVLLKLEIAGLNNELAQSVIESKNNLLAMKVIELIERNGYEPTTTQKYARQIMGNNYFGVEEAIKHFKVKPLKGHLTALVEVPFTEGVLEACKDTHILVAVFPLSILNIRKVDNKLFYSSTEGWYKNQEFAQNNGEAKWQLVQKTPVDDSISKNWNEQQALLSDTDETPSAQIMVYTIIGHYMNIKQRLFENIYVRCSCVGSDGGRVHVGAFDSDGLDVHNYWDDDRYSCLGLSSARKF